jgi:hypothetical protein
MQTFREHQSGISVISTGVDVKQRLDDMGLDYKFEDDYLIINDISRENVENVIDNLPYDIDYDVFAHTSSPDSDDDVYLGDEGEDLLDLYSVEATEFTVIIYLYNTDIYDNIYEVKRVVKVNSKGKRRIKMKCRKGFKWTGGKCHKISGSEMTTKRRAIKKAVRTKKAKGSGFNRIMTRKRNKAMKKRKGLGLRRK